MGQTRLQLSGGYCFPAGEASTPEDIVSKWDTITDFGECCWAVRMHITELFQTMDERQALQMLPKL
jgi:hypothetical protein